MSSQIRLHKTSLSQPSRSRSVSQYLSFSDIVEITDEELVKQVNSLKREVKILTLENEILERTMMRVEPSLMHGIQQAMEHAIKLRTSSSMNISSFIRSNTRFTSGMGDASLSRLTSPSRVSTTRRVESFAKVGAAASTTATGSRPKINILEKSELVSAETEQLLGRLERIRANAARKHALLKAQLEEISIRNGDVDKATESFNQQVIINGWDKIAKRIPAEIWVRFMNEWVTLCDKDIGKLRLRTSTANTQFTKLKGQIEVKSELSASLRPVDFEKLKIENQVGQETIEKKTAQLKLLKTMTGEANLNLTIHKKLMLEQNEYLASVKKNIEQKNLLTKQKEKEKIKIAVQAEKMAEKFEEIKKKRLVYEVPDIMDYVGIKAEVTELKRSIKLLEHRCHIQHIALKSLHKQIQSMLFE